ncbi:DUF1285 domain-containing protein [Psychrobacter phenylpyruvicus]|uniref:Uncharacterized protein conserved in bacteria n=1 Tax=Psychrobacter phenylpyruvicus TaxID=29432 RepID=A0A379LME7_9GAMM|nr:DUF1285 domain-containing protein [Psychrobacter phenylpyruvicus]SUD91760.1 Uncharacterized protein conserved in bacteria [Psychrobacter phenylpyruvicus]
MSYLEQQSGTVSSSLDSLSEFIKQESSDRRGRSIPPLEKWHPERQGEMDMVIKANGEWWHEGSKISRQSLVDLFATVLWREGTDQDPIYYLKTPVEKIRIQVEDAPFLITEVNLIEQKQQADAPLIEFITSTGDVVPLDDEHPLVMGEYQGEQRPYIEVRFGMKGLISRNVLMHLIKLGELTEQDGKTSLTLHSGGKAYSVTVEN